MHLSEFILEIGFAAFGSTSSENLFALISPALGWNWCFAFYELPQTKTDAALSVLMTFTPFYTLSVDFPLISSWFSLKRPCPFASSVSGSSAVP